MAKLGISRGWTPPPAFQLPTEVGANFSEWVGISLTDELARDIEQATDRFIEERCIEAGYIDRSTGKVVRTTAEFGPTRDRLNKTLAALKAFKHFLECDDQDLDANAVAARWFIAEQSDNSIKVPNTEKLRFDIESWEILAYRAINALKRDDDLERRGRPPERPLKTWATTIARKIEKCGGCTIEKTRSRRRLASGFGRLIRCLCNAMRARRVYLPADRTVIKHAGDAIIERQGKAPRSAPKTRSQGGGGGRYGVRGKNRRHLRSAD
jgi:hypothetical protein